MKRIIILQFRIQRAQQPADGGGRRGGTRVAAVRVVEDPKVDSEPDGQRYDQHHKDDTAERLKRALAAAGMKVRMVYLFG